MLVTMLRVGPRKTHLVQAVLEVLEVLVPEVVRAPGRVQVEARVPELVLARVLALVLGLERGLALGLVLVHQVPVGALGLVGDLVLGHVG